MVQVKGDSENEPGVIGTSNTSVGVLGNSEKTYGTAGNGALGVLGNSNNNGIGVAGVSDDGSGLSGSAINVGIYGENRESGNVAYIATRCCAGDFHGDVYVLGKVTKQGGSFKIDHPLEPINKYLSHSIVESPDMKNIYDGVAIIDAKGNAVVELPAWFEALNKDFRYQLTPIGAAGPNLYIAEEISHNRFRISGGTPGMKVSWMVTGIRKDPWANAHRIQVEEEKPANELGYYLNPELYNQPEEKSIMQVKYSTVLQQARKIKQDITLITKRAGKQGK